MDSDDYKSTKVPEDQDVDDDLEEEEQLSEPSGEPNPAAEEPFVPAGHMKPNRTVTRNVYEKMFNNKALICDICFCRDFLDK